MGIARTSLRGTTLNIPWKTYSGYTLFAPMGANYVWLINMRGQVVHRWEMPYTPGCHGKLLPNGNLLYAGKKEGGQLTDLMGCGGKLIEVDWDGNLVWEYEDYFLHHTFCRMKNGRTIVLKWVPVPRKIAVKVKGGIPGTERDGIMWSDAIQEIAPSGRVVWEWFAYEHLDPESDIICPLDNRDEWTYTNAVDVFPNGDILVSFCRINTIAIIDKQTGDIRWKWGASREVKCKNGALWGAGHELAHQNGATIINNGNLLLFDNGLHPPNIDFGYSRVLEINPESKRVVWIYQNSCWSAFYSSIMGGCERLPNGNTLICESTSGRIFEVTHNQEMVWEYVNPYYYEVPYLGKTNIIFRAYRYGPEYVGLRGKNLDYPGERRETLSEGAIFSTKI